MDGEEGGVAVASRLRPELEGGDVEGTVRLTTGESSPSPVRGHSWPEEAIPAPCQWQPAFLPALDACPPTMPLLHLGSESAHNLPAQTLH